MDYLAKIQAEKLNSIWNKWILQTKKNTTPRKTQMYILEIKTMCQK